MLYGVFPDWLIVLVLLFHLPFWRPIVNFDHSVLGSVLLFPKSTFADVLLFETDKCHLVGLVRAYCSAGKNLFFMNSRRTIGRWNSNTSTIAIQRIHLIPFHHTVACICTKSEKKDLLFQRNFLGISQGLNYGDVEGSSIAISQGSTGQSRIRTLPIWTISGKFPPRTLPTQTLPNRSVPLTVDYQDSDVFVTPLLAT